jgi:NAD(P)-dependent dehydrogenase (short-subunit alcohol dehydrogenase family)
MCKYFLQTLGMSKPGAINTLTAGLAVMVRPGVSAYSLSKLAAYQMMPFIAAENLQVTAVGLYPGIVKTKLVSEEMARFAKDTPALVGGSTVWLATDAARFMSGRFVASTWSVDDLMARSQEIQSKDLLKIQLNAKLRPQRFGN